jgi:hypothetical protein
MGEKKRLNKKGQVTIFIIIAILIVAICVLIFLYYPKIFGSLTPETKNPLTYIQECIGEQIEENIQRITLQGGDYYITNTNAAYFYKDEEDDEGNYVRYLCYTNANKINTPCVDQEPFLTKHIENETLNSIKSDIDVCFTRLVKSYERKRYEVELKTGTPRVEILPGVISTNFNRTLILKRGDETSTYRKFEVNLESNLYEILEIAKNILAWETISGESIPEAYTYINPYIKVERRTKDNDVEIYILTDKNTGESFRFAIRSFPIPAGWGDVENE